MRSSNLTLRDICVVHLPEVMGHDWRVGIDITIEHAEFFQAHNPVPAGWVWVECRDCEVCRMCHEEDAPARGRAPLHTILTLVDIAESA